MCVYIYMWSPPHNYVEREREREREREGSPFEGIHVEFRLGFKDIIAPILYWEISQKGGCQNYGLFWGTLNIRCRSIIGIHKGTTFLTTTQTNGKEHGTQNRNWINIGRYMITYS